MTEKGRPKKYSTKEEADKAAKEYQKNYLEVRRKRYRDDSEYRRKSIERDRDYYRNSTAGFVPKQFGWAAGTAATYSKDDSGVLLPKEMASFLGVREKVLNKWIDSKKFPVGDVAKNGKPSYSAKFADKLALILRDGLYNRGAFRSTDVDVIRQLFEVKTRHNEPSKKKASD